VALELGALAGLETALEVVGQDLDELAAGHMIDVGAAHGVAPSLR